MRKLYIERELGSLNYLSDAKIICNAKTIGTLSKEETKGEYTLPKGEAAIQVEIFFNEKPYRSNAIFLLRKKDFKLKLIQSGTKLNLKVIE